MKFFCEPNLPLNNVTDVIMSGEYSFLIDELNKMGINVIKTNACSYIPYYERFHTDLQLSYYRKGEVAICKETSFLNFNIDNLTVEKTFTRLNNKYPYNIAFNHVIMGDKFICKSKYTDVMIKDYCVKNNFQIIEVNQGYTKCSTAVVNENAVITSDVSIFKQCIKYKIDVLKIDVGYINLYGYDYGFIGGCCGKISKDIIAFTGNLNVHKNCDDIKSFLRNYNIYSVALSNKPVFDIGSIFPVTETD